MSVEEIIRELSKLTAEQRALVRRRLLELEAETKSSVLHEPPAMSSELEQIESRVRGLSKSEQEILSDWLENLLEDRLEFTDEFKASIARGEGELSEVQDARRSHLRAFFGEWDATHSVTVGEKPSRERTYGDNPRVR